MFKRHLPLLLVLGWPGLFFHVSFAADAPGAPVFPPQFTAFDRVLLTHGCQIYNQLCFACHGVDGRGTPYSAGGPGATMAPTLRGSKIATGLRDGAINALLKGISGPVDGKTYTAQMVPMETSNDEWIAASLSYVRNSFGNDAGMILPDDVARVRAIYTNRLTPWTIPELLATLPQPLADRWRWKLSASRNPAAARLAISGAPDFRYRTRAPQAPGVWFQIRFPWATSVSGLVLDAGDSPQDFPRGYEVRLSDNGVRWSAPVAAGHGTGARTEILFSPARTRFIRVTLTAAAPGHDWSIHDLQVLPPAPVPSQSAAAQPKSSVYE
jgi:mono/diheme cytochrome c family protein